MGNIDHPNGCMGRREFLVKAGFLAGGVVLTVSSLKDAAGAVPFEDLKIMVGADSPLAKVGGFKIVDSSAGKLIVIRSADTDYEAYSAICTHKGAVVMYDSGEKKIVCPKHGSEWTVADGKVAKGPTTAPLRLYPIKPEKDELIVTVS